MCIRDRKTAVFFIISDTTQTYNFLVALAFSQMFNLLCERADNVHGGNLCFSLQRRVFFAPGVGGIDIFGLAQRREN